MGTYNKGILGAFSGKVGPVVGANWRGKDVLRSLPKKSKKEPTEVQLRQRQKFAFVTAFLTPLTPMMGRYFGQKSGDRSKRNMAMSYHMKEAVTYNGAEWEMVYPKVQISKGELLGVAVPVATAEAGGIIRLEWKNNSGQATAKADDELVAVVYDPLNKTSEMFFKVGLRADEQGELQVHDSLIGMEVHCWIAFVSTDEKRYATSNYLGTIKVL
ncbi:hypothetical protein J2X31_000120 [Flavobacterium arsenatis]|uniref:Uncharacterized protein n=1 Tax=Flavobacterium arsenatis TaxID=1484332 RepID=A0ABU1TL25_9FLAO|nr:DUF6266 family protein [Flavobacterium arsenatis]MDR6966127.1 hypothetical protein [Flavobacterium arsenatis]